MVNGTHIVNGERVMIRSVYNIITTCTKSSIGFQQIVSLVVNYKDVTIETRNKVFKTFKGL